MIEWLDVTKVYGKTKALEEISFAIEQGEIVGIVGKSGSGKSTLLRLLNLMEQPSSGKILVNGIDVQSLSKKAKRQQQQKMGMIFQNYNLLENLRVYENVALPLKLQRKKEPAKINRLLEFVDMSHKASTYPVKLSGGEKQRVSIARALSRNPEILLCDEATSSLDEENTESVIHLLQKVHEEFQPTIFFVSHELETVKRLCKTILVMENGRLIGKLMNNPRKYEEENLTYFEKIKRSLA
ncbi:ATP-binding cassette domain-containing protein [Enterococcus ratti]|uniref:ABC transporter ATP-binding protein n=1 Tax=Enterococcus ratti TaxID=150033 RepID=A0A1L8WSC0_9ENTE|nr:ATP-binding cassette domain-containing protein [Enterococcus ratti]OJG83917.1 ABC transporter ATP-binding protein [Enterococcus ratti]